METLFIGKSLLFLTEVESTNTYAMGLLRNVNVTEGTIVHTDHQTKGRGQRGAAWNSEYASNLTLSVVLKPQFLSAGKAFYLSKISALALYDVMAEILPQGQYDIKVKWPNDILVNSKKIAGILIENNFQQDHIQHAVIGIGLNVNQQEFAGLENKATSLLKLTGRQFNRQAVLERLCVHLEKWYLRLREGRQENITLRYLENLYGYQQILPFRDARDYPFSACVTGVSENGNLRLSLAGGVIQEFDIKEVKFEL